MATRVYKLEVTVVDHNEYGLDSIINQIENTSDGHPRVIGTPLAKDVDWDDNLPINLADGHGEQALRELFAEPIEAVRERLRDALWQTYDTLIRPPSEETLDRIIAAVRGKP